MAVIETALMLVEHATNWDERAPENKPSVMYLSIYNYPGSLAKQITLINGPLNTDSLINTKTNVFDQPETIWYVIIEHI